MDEYSRVDFLFCLAACVFFSKFFLEKPQPGGRIFPKKDLGALQRLEELHLIRCLAEETYRTSNIRSALTHFPGRKPWYSRMNAGVKRSPLKRIIVGCVVVVEIDCQVAKFLNFSY